MNTRSSRLSVLGGSSCSLCSTFLDYLYRQERKDNARIAKGVSVFFEAMAVHGDHWDT